MRGTTITSAITARSSSARGALSPILSRGLGGANHVLPTAGGAKHSAGLSVSRFLKPLTYQRISREATPELAKAVQVISDSEGMAAHSATATMRLSAYRA